MHQNLPFILEGYYTVCETLSNDNTLRLYDQSVWEKQRNEH